MNDFDPTDTTANEERNAEVQAAARRAVEQEVEDLKWLTSDKRGRRILWRLLTFTGVFRNPWRGTSQTDFLCGMMHVGQQYLTDINQHAPERYNQMVTENTK